MTPFYSTRVAPGSSITASLAAQSIDTSSQEENGADQEEEEQGHDVLGDGCPHLGGFLV